MKMRSEQALKSGDGFTLLEVMISLGILGVGLMAVIILQVSALREGSRARHTTAAAMIVRDQLERIQRIPYSSTDLDPVAWTTPPWLANGGNPALNPGEVPVRVTQSSGTATEHVYTVFYRVTADAGGNANLRDVDVEVTWTEDGISNNRPTRTGRPTAAVSTVILNNDR